MPKFKTPVALNLPPLYMWKNRVFYLKIIAKKIADDILKVQHCNLIFVTKEVFYAIFNIRFAFYFD